MAVVTEAKMTGKVRANRKSLLMPVHYITKHYVITSSSKCSRPKARIKWNTARVQFLREVVSYAVTEKSALHIFDTESGELKATQKVGKAMIILTPALFAILITKLQLTDSEIIAIIHHPLSNVLAVLGDDGQISFWRP